MLPSQINYYRSMQELKRREKRTNFIKKALKAVLIKDKVIIK